LVIFHYKEKPNLKTIFILFYDRYTSSKDGQFVYGSLLDWPNKTTEITFGAPKSSSSTIITLLGSSVGPLKWQPANATGGIIVDVSNINLYLLQSRWTWVFKFQNI
jgi:hypothetical protein